MRVSRNAMGDVAKSLYILIVAGFFADASAELPPEILVDKYLIQAQHLHAAKDYAAAFDVMQKIIALQKEQDLAVPDEFHFKYGQVALSADSIHIALESVTRYLAATGKEGEFYKEALALLVEAEESQISTEEMCTGKPEGALCLKELDNHQDCYVWDNINRSNIYSSRVTVSWSGACQGAAARGKETLIWNVGGSEDTWSGRLRQGRPHGHWVLRNRFGYESSGPFANWKRQGHWIVHTA